MVTKASVKPVKPAVATTKKPVLKASVEKVIPVVKAKPIPAVLKKPVSVKKVVPATTVTVPPKSGAIIVPPKSVPTLAAARTKPVPEQKIKAKKAKLVRDSFTMPEDEYQVLNDVKKACLKAGMAVKKSELLRIGVALIKGLDSAKLKAAIASLPLVKAGRPKKDK